MELLLPGSSECQGQKPAHLQVGWLRFLGFLPLSGFTRPVDRLSLT